MATTYLRLFDPTQQFQLKSGAINTAGLLRVYLNGTDDLADIYDENGTQLAQPAVLDNNGRALGLFVDSKKTYRLEVYDQFDSLLFTVRNMTPCGGGGGSSLGSQYDLVSTDGSVSIDKSVDAGKTTFDLSADKGSPEVIVTASAERTTDGAFRFSAPTSHSGTKLSVDDGTVMSDRQFIHFEATVRLVWSSQQNAEADIQFRCMDTVESVRFDLSFPHTEFLDVSADYEVTNDGTAIPVTVSGLPTGLSATVENFSVHAITKRYGEGSEYRAGNGITIQTGEIAIDPTVVQEKLEAGANISIVGNVISATAEPQQPADWAATEGVTRILNKPNLDIYATHSEVTYGLAQKQDTISDLSTIRSGAAAGATAVQPSEMDSALAGKQDVISDLSTIRSGAAKGATSVQPADLAPYAVASDVESALAGKQDVISDLSAIRAGAQSGATAVQPATMNSALAGKQDTISDLATIRSGASAGATAVQPATMNTALAGKQDVINDLSDIRSGAAAGATAVQPAEMNTALAGKQDTISDLATIRSGAAAGATAVQPADMNTALAGKEDAANKSQTLDPTSTTEFPSSAATASFVNSSVATNTATFRGNFKLPDLGLTYPATDAQIEAALDAHTWPVGVVPTNNDYVYVEIENPQTTGIDDVVKRFKFNGTDWHYEYTLNNSSFTAAEKAAIDSGIDSAKVAIYDAHVANGDIHVTEAEKATWNAKQDAISDLSTIRSGAAAGATAVQDPDYVHTDNNFTSAEKTKLTGIEAGAQVNVNADWNAASGTDAYIANKPQNLVQDASYVHTDENFTSAEKTKLAGIEAGAQVNVKPDWNAAAGTDDEILNKPAIPSGAQLVPAATSSDASKVLTVNSIGTPEWAAAQAPISAGSGIDIANNTVSAKVDGTTVTVNGSGQLQATQPTVDQTYNSSSANAQSGTAVAGAIAGKEDEFSAGDGLEFTTDGQGNRVLQVEAPVDIVAGPGIVVDNPDGNTLRVSLREDYEEVLYAASTDAGTTLSVNGYITLSESLTHFEKVKIYYALQQSWGGAVSHEIYKVSGDQRIVLEQLWFREQSGYNNYWQTITFSKYSDTNLTITLVDGSQRPLLQNSWGSTGLTLTVFKVVGINRIAGGN